MIRHCKVLPGGTIFLGRQVSCDGFSLRPVRVITHVHDDHIRGFESSLGVHEAIVMLPATKDLLLAIKGKRSMEIRRNLIAVEASTLFSFGREKITLVAANHILGSAQVLVETEEGYRVAYTVDFGWPTTVLKVEELVIDATYGSPEYVRAYKEEDVIRDLVELVDDLVRKQRIRVCVKAFTGRLQYAMQQLQGRVNVPFLAGRRQTRIAEVYRDYGVLVDEVVDRMSPEGVRIANEKEPFVTFHHLAEKIPETEYDVCVYISAYMVPKEDPVIQTGSRTYRVALTDHADFNETLAYVQESAPKVVLVDNSRGGDARSLATEIKSRLGIEAVVGGYG